MFEYDLPPPVEQLIPKLRKKIHPQATVTQQWRIYEYEEDNLK